MYEYVIEDGGTVQDMLLTALRDIEANLAGRDCCAERWQDSARRAKDALATAENARFCSR